jgi:hypothetical protein
MSMAALNNVNVNNVAQLKAMSSISQHQQWRKLYVIINVSVMA